MPKVGAFYSAGNGSLFTVWAPLLQELTLHITHPRDRVIPLERGERGFWQAHLPDEEPGARYVYRLPNGDERPDPASFYQPDDIMAPSCLIDHGAYRWQDKNWQNTPLKDYIIYEMHTGTFTSEGTFAAAVKRLDDLKELGITAVEIMPVSQFPGERGWGYDLAYPFSVQHSYGGPDGLKLFVDACHARGISVVLDVVYNHLGPEGNFLPQFMPVFTDKYTTPWGKAINFDDRHSHGVRNYFIQNALYWLEIFHIDALRLDAVHGIFDASGKHFLQELAENVNTLSDRLGRKCYLIAESDLNDNRIIRATNKGGYGIDAQWSDDLHHALHALLTGEDGGYYRDFGQIQDLAKAVKQGYVYDWTFSEFRQRYHGSPAEGIAPDQLVICLQNHDQVGNRLKGERTAALLPFEALKLAAGAVLLSPQIPLLFMGEEYGERAPFLYFMSFYDENLIRAVREGRKKEFAAFDWQEEPPDPYALETFTQSKLNWSARENGDQRILLKFYKRLIALRKSTPAFHVPDKSGIRADVLSESILFLERAQNAQRYCSVLNCCDAKGALEWQAGSSGWRKILDSADTQWQGPGALLPELVVSGDTVHIQPYNFAVYETAGT